MVKSISAGLLGGVPVMSGPLLDSLTGVLSHSIARIEWIFGFPTGVKFGRLAMLFDIAATTCSKMIISDREFADRQVSRRSLRANLANFR
jgi:hypothetical protein